MNLGSQVTIINISLWKLLWVINAPCEQRRLELSQMSCNRAARYASPYNRHQLTGPSYIRSLSLTKSLPSFLLSLSSHAVGYVPARVHFTVAAVRGGIAPPTFFFISEGFLLWFSGAPGLKNGAFLMSLCDISIVLGENTQSSADRFLKHMNYDSGTYIKAPTLHITMSKSPGSLVRNNVTLNSWLLRMCVFLKLKRSDST